MSISRDRLLSNIASCTSEDALEADAVAIARSLKLELPEWFTDLSAAIEINSSSGSTKRKLWAACLVDGESFALIETNGRLEVCSTTSGETWALPSTESATSSSVTVATLLVRDGHMDVWVGDSKGKVQCFLLDLATNEGFELIASTVVSSPVLSLRAVPWTSALSCFLCWVTTSSSILLCGAPSEADLRVCIAFSLPAGRCKTVLRSELVDSSNACQALFAAYFAAPDNHIVAIAIDAIAASILAQRVLSSNQPILQLPATVALDAALSSSSSSSRVFFGSRSGLPTFATLLPHSIIGLHSCGYDWSNVENIFRSPPGLSVVVVEDSTTVHLFTLDTPCAQIVSALSHVDVHHSAQYTTATITLHTLLTRTTFPHGQDDSPTVSPSLVHESPTTLPLWRACVDYHCQLPWRSEPIKKIAHQLETQSLPARDQALAVKVILLEAMLAVGLCTRVQQCLAAPPSSTGGGGEESEDGIQRLFDWVASPSPVLSTPSLVEDCKTALTSTLLFRALPYLLCTSPHIPPVPSLVLRLAMEEAFGLWKAVLWLMEALLDRKLVALCAPGSDGVCDERAIALVLPDSLLSRSTVEVFALHEMMRVLGVTLRLVHVMTKMFPLGVGLQAFLPLQRGSAASSSSSAAASLLSERQACRERGLPSAPYEGASREKTRLPECLHSLSLFDVLVSQLPPGLRPLVDVSSLASQEPAQALREVVLLPYYAMEVCLRDVLDSRSYVGMSLEQVRRQCAHAVHTSRWVVLYLLVDNYDALGEDIQALYEDFAQALQCTHAEVVCAAAMQAMDRGQPGAVERLVNYDAFCVLDTLSWPAAQSMALRMLSLGLQEEAHSFMMQLAAREDPFLQTKEGVVAYLATLSEQDWEMKWQRGRMMADELSSVEEGLEARAIMATFLCEWGVQHRMLADVLQQDFHPVEFDVVLAFLTDRAIADTERLVAPSDAVDTLVAWLLTHHRYEEARDVHSTHLQALQQCRLVLTEEARRSFQDRQVLLDMHDRVPALPTVDYQILRQLKE